MQQRKADRKLEKQIDEAAAQYRVEIGSLEFIPSVGHDSAMSIISEVGTNMGHFPNEQHLSSWSGMSLGNNQSGGKKSDYHRVREQVFAMHFGGKCLGRNLEERQLL
ncbi:MAG: transposase [Bacteroidota bacterium]